MSSRKKANNELNNFIRKDLDIYFDIKKGAGGHLAEFLHQELERLLGNPEQHKKFLADAFGSAIVNVWREGEGGDDEDEKALQLCFDGITVPQRLRYRDESVPGGYTTVLARYATVGQLDASARLKLTKANESQSAALRDMHAAEEAIKRAGGNMSVLLSDISDVA
jgi:hypothetical protein